ncbi:MAG: putative lipid phosphate phosphatase YodM [Friedmanniella sp.]|nr:putative lipid phosphate phosphatase YodM [Friedmanniella sp.]
MIRLHDDTASEQRIGQRDLTHWPSGVGRWLVHLAHRLRRVASAQAVLLVTAGVGLLLVAGATLAGLGVYDAVAEHDGVAGFDRPVLNEAISLRNARLDSVLTGFTHLGGPAGMTVIAAIITALMVWRWRSRTPLVLMLLAVAGSLTMTLVGKAAVGRVRPPLGDAVPPFEYSPSFPSGHALNSTVIAGLVAYLVVRRLESRLARALTIAAAAAWAVAIGLSRVFLGHHWLTDVMFGWAVGLAWLLLLITAHRLFLTVRESHRSAATAS